VPGAGIPMAVISSKLVADRILKKLAFWELFNYFLCYLY
jgi:hypothetical protein